MTLSSIPINNKVGEFFSIFSQKIPSIQPKNNVTTEVEGYLSVIVVSVGS